MSKIQLSVPNLSLDIMENIKETIETGWVSTGGRFISEFEEKLAKYIKVNRAVAVQSGTAGLHLSLKVLGANKDSEVIVPTVTFIAAVNPVTYCGAEPVFIDCDETLNIDVNKIEHFLRNECEIIDGNTVNKSTKKIVKGIVVVHVFGNPVDMSKIMKLREEFNLFVLEDATEALGSYYVEGPYKNKYCGSIGDIGVFSFNANKIITTGGGGMVVSNNNDLLNKISFLGVQAKTDSLFFVHDEIGYNYRMTNIQAAFGVSQIDKLDEFIEVKRSNYNRYAEGIKQIKGLELLEFNKNSNPNYWFYSVYVHNDYPLSRNQLLTYLDENDIVTRPLWKLIHTQKPYQSCYSNNIQLAFEFEQNVINIPCSSNLSSEQVDYVINTLKQV